MEIWLKASMDSGVIKHPQQLIFHARIVVSLLSLNNLLLYIGFFLRFKILININFIPFFDSPIRRKSG